MPFKDIVRKTLLAYFAKLNKKYGSRGLEFYVQDNHYWIEIRIDTSKANAYRKSTNWDPNQMSEESEQDEDEQNQGPNHLPTQADGNLFTNAREDEGGAMLRDDEFENGKSKGLVKRGK